jgi:hypothetical protein
MQKEKMFFLVILMLWPMVSTRLNLYDTDRKIGSEQVQFDCIHYYALTANFPFQWYFEKASQTIKYCRRPLNVTNISTPIFLEHHRNKFTFKELRHLNVTTKQLFSWFAPVDLIERYVLYIEQSDIDDPLPSEIFYKCSDNWFGPRCQYTFYTVQSSKVKDVIETLAGIITSDSTVFTSVIDLSCYVHLKCDRGKGVCLDWREICNGQIDCIGDDADEENCFELEINECAEDEYRCHNGMCISKDFYQDDVEHPDCLDLSDESAITLPYGFCSKNPRFRCEEQACRADLFSFPCGDGQCTNDVDDSCDNERDGAVEWAMMAKGDLSEHCWAFMASHTFMVDQIDQDSCTELFKVLNIIDCAMYPTVNLFFCIQLIPFSTDIYVFSTTITNRD